MTDDTGNLARDWVIGRAEMLEQVSDTDRHGKPLRTVINMDTGLVRNDPIPGDEELARFYSEDYRTSYKGAEKPRKRQILRNFRRAAAHVEMYRDVLGQAATVLDVGAGSGEFAFLMTEMGKTVTGIEPNAGYAAYCRDDLALDIRTAHLSQDLFAQAEFDLIRLNHVLEHLNDPVGYLHMISQWLTPGGLLYVEVPNIETYAREKSRGNMFHFGHIFNFNPWTLRMAAALAGLDEASETAARSADTTGVFFRRSTTAIEAQDASSPDNAQKVREMIRRHYAGQFREGKAAKPIVKLSNRVEETLTGLRLGTPQDIGRKIAHSIAAVPGAGETSR